MWEKHHKVLWDNTEVIGRVSNLLKRSRHLLSHLKINLLVTRVKVFPQIGVKIFENISKIVKREYVGNGLSMSQGGR